MKRNPRAHGQLAGNVSKTGPSFKPTIKQNTSKNRGWKGIHDFREAYAALDQSLVAAFEEKYRDIFNYFGYSTYTQLDSSLEKGPKGFLKIFKTIDE